MHAVNMHMQKNPPTPPPPPNNEATRDQFAYNIHIKKKPSVLQGIGLTHFENVSIDMNM